MPLPQMILFGVFFFLVGACVGSFLNVVIWRLPHRGREVAYQGKTAPMTLSWPPSHCPMCDAPIAPYQNIPVLSYIFLRGKCAKCKAHIPIRYPLVELATSMLWGGLFLAYFVGHVQGPIGWLNPHVGGVDSFVTGWPVLVWHALLISALLAASAIDADLFIIPLSIVWLLVILGLGGSALIGQPLTPEFAIVPHLTQGGWALAKPVAGAGLGLLIANLLLKLKILPRSFPWELEGLDAPIDAAKEEPAKKPALTEEKEEPLAPPPKLSKFWPSVIVTILLVGIAASLWLFSTYQIASVVTIAVGIVVFLLGVLPRDAGQVDVTDEVVEEISGPGIRMEILKEVLFIAIPLACAAIFYVIPYELPQTPWLMRLLGSVLGLLAGGGSIWLLRIGGSWGFNKQAMGIGDVHLMAGVGAIIGAPLALLTLPLSAFVGIVWAIILKIQGKPNVLPYGPWLSVAAILSLIVGNPLICWYLSMMGLGC